MGIASVAKLDVLYGIVYFLHIQNSKVDMQNDWKLLTIFIGTNDLCLGSVCRGVCRQWIHYKVTLVVGTKF